MFKEYQSKQIVRRAHKVTPSDTITKVAGAEASYMLTSSDGYNCIFKAYEGVKVGDYIVYLKGDDIYHCSAEVFADRNILPSTNKKEAALEKEIVDKGLTAPRLTPDHIDDCILQWDYHVFEDTCLTVCCMTLINGFTVTGESACASPTNFDVAIGKKIAYDKAREKIWMLEGYLLKEKLSLEDNGPQE